LGPSLRQRKWLQRKARRCLSIGPFDVSKTNRRL
jgi:hypothetical protein